MNKYLKLCSLFCVCIIIGGIFYFLATRLEEAEEISFQGSKNYEGHGGYTVKFVEDKVVWDVPHSDGNVNINGLVEPDEWNYAKKYVYSSSCTFSLYLKHDGTYLYILLHLWFGQWGQRIWSVYLFFGSTLPITEHVEYHHNATYTFSLDGVFGGKDGIFLGLYGDPPSMIGNVLAEDILIGVDGDSEEVMIEVRIPLKYLSGLEHAFNIVGVPYYSPKRRSCVFYSLGGNGSAVRFLPYNSFWLKIFSIVIPLFLILLYAVWQLKRTSFTLRKELSQRKNITKHISPPCKK
ncbi:MAG: hypothetical protein QXD64_08730 [Thermoplasmata archaeon]